MANYLRNPTGYGSTRGGGREPKMSERQKRLVFCAASERILSSHELFNELPLPVNLSALRAMLRDNENYKKAKTKCVLPLTENHKRKEIDWAKAHVTFSQLKWSGVIFSDQKNVNLDGSDGWLITGTIWAVKGKIGTSRQMGGGSVLVWSLFSANRKSELVFLYGRKNANKYAEVLNQALLPFINAHKVEVILQLGNASIHTAKARKKGFQTTMLT